MSQIGVLARKKELCLRTAKAIIGFERWKRVERLMKRGKRPNKGFTVDDDYYSNDLDEPAHEDREDGEDSVSINDGQDEIPQYVDDGQNVDLIFDDGASDASLDNVVTDAIHNMDMEENDNPILQEDLADNNLSMLPLPSQIGLDAFQDPSIHHLIEYELQLREGQANDALERLRDGLAHKSLIYRTELRHMQSNDGRTRLRDNLKLVERKVKLSLWILN